MSGVAIGVELFGSPVEGLRVGGHVPEGLFERLVAEIPTEEQKMMGNRRSLLAPLGDQAGGEGVPEIVNTRTNAISVYDEIPRDRAKHTMDGVLVKGTSVASHK